MRTSWKRDLIAAVQLWSQISISKKKLSTALTINHSPRPFYSEMGRPAVDLGLTIRKLIVG
jgi:hypothetical protein